MSSQFKINVLRSMAVLLFLGWLIAIFLLASLSGLENVLTSFLSMTFDSILFSILLFILVNLLWILNWRLIISSTGIKVSLKLLLYSMLAGFFVDNITPTILIAGEVMMAYTLKILSKDKIRMAESVATITFQMFCWFLGTSLFGIVAISLGFFQLGMSIELLTPLLILLTIFSFFFVAIISLIYWRNFAERTLLWFASKFSNVISRLDGKSQLNPVTSTQEWLNRFYDTLSSIPNSKSRLLLGGVIFTIRYLLEAYVILLLIEGLGFHISFSQASLVLLVTVLTSLISLIPGGIGVFEATMGSILLASGIPSFLAIIGIAVFRFLFFWIPTLLGMFVSIKVGVEVIELGGESLEDNDGESSL